MNKHSLLKELNKQEERIMNADEKKKKEEQKLQKEGIINAKSPVKRKLKYSNATSKKRVGSFRQKLDDAEKDKFRLSAKKGMADHREKLYDAEKVEIKDKTRKRIASETIEIYAPLSGRLGMH